MAKQSNTALVLVQPHTLLYKNSIQHNTPLADHKHSFEDFTSAARERGACVVYIGSSTRLWWRLIELSDAIFVLEERDFLWKKEPKKLKKDEAQRKLTEDEKKYLKEKKALFLEEGPQSYAPITEALAKRFQKLGVTGILACGGYDNDCIRLFLENLHKKMRELEINIASNFVVRGCGTQLFSKRMEEAKIEVKPAAGDSTALLKLFNAGPPHQYCK